MMSASLSIEEVIDLICGDDSLREMAASAVKDEVDYIYGYSKYTLEEIDWELELRLYSMTYLAKAIVRILKHPKVDLDIKKTLCSSYLNLLEPYVKGELPKPVYEWEFEPDYTIEMAVFLDSIGEMDWKDYGLLDLIMIYSESSTVESRGRFLERFIERINMDGEMLEYYTSPRPEDSEEMEVSRMSVFDLIPALIATMPPDKASRLEISQSTLNLMKVLSLIIGSKLRRWRNVPLRVLGRLRHLSNGDIMWMMDHLAFFRIPNCVKACEDLYMALNDREEDLEALLRTLTSQLKKKQKHDYRDEPKVKGLLRAVSKLPGDKSRFVELARGLLNARITPGAKLSVYKFIYETGGDRRILEMAKKERLKTIREWAAKTSKTENP